MNLEENKLAKPVAEWLKSRGYEVYSEVPVLQSNVDIVGFNGNKLISIELKTGWNSKLLRQVQNGLLWADEVYACTPRKPQTKTMDWLNEEFNKDIGILIIQNGAAKVIRTGKGDPNTIIHTKTIELIKHMSPGYNMAGTPCLKGEGQCQAVMRGIDEYLKEHPKATWKELHANVPNHYRTYKNMYSAIRSNEIRLAYRKRLKEERIPPAQRGESEDKPCVK